MINMGVRNAVALGYRKRKPAGILRPNQIRGAVSIVLTHLHDHLVRWKRNELDGGGQSRLELVRVIFWFPGVRNAQREFSVRRNVTNFVERWRLLGIARRR